MNLHRLSRAVISQFCFAAILLIAAFLNVQAQTWTQYDQGTPPQHAGGVSPLGSYLSTDLGTINLSNGSLNLSLPMGTAGGRGFSIPISLNYSSKVWSVAHDTAYWPPPHDMDVDMAYARYAAGDTYEDIFFRVAPGWVVGGMPLLKRQNVGITPCPGLYNAVYVLEKLTVVLPDKGEIELRDDYSDGAPFYTNCSVSEYRGQRWHATDGSGIVFMSDVDNGVALGSLAGTLITGDGMRYRFTTMGVPAAYASKNWGNGAKFLDSIVHHVNKSVDHVAIDLTGASKSQIKTIQKFVSGLAEEQKKKIIYVQ